MWPSSREEKVRTNKHVFTRVIPNLGFLGPTLYHGPKLNFVINEMVLVVNSYKIFKQYNESIS